MTIDLNAVLQALVIASVLGGVALLRNSLMGLGRKVDNGAAAFNSHVEEDAKVHTKHETEIVDMKEDIRDLKAMPREVTNSGR